MMDYRLINNYMVRTVTALSRYGMLCSLVIFYLGCAPKSINVGASATAGDSQPSKADTLTTETQSPYKPPTPLPRPEPQVSLDTRKLELAKGELDQGLRGLFGLETQDSQPFLVSIGKDGRILARWLEHNNRPYLVGEVAPVIDVNAFSPVRGLVASVEAAGIVVSDISGGLAPMRLSRLDTRITALEFSPDGESLLIGGADGMIYLWRFHDQLLGMEKNHPERLLHRYPGLGAAVATVAFHQSGKFFFASDLRGEVVAWQKYGTDKYGGKYDQNISGQRFFTTKTIRTPIRPGGGVSVDQIALDPSGQFLILALQDGNLELWKLKGILLQNSVKAHDGQIVSLTVEPREDSEIRLVTVGKDGKLKTWGIHSYEAIVEEKVKKRAWMAAMASANPTALPTDVSSEGGPMTIKRKSIQHDFVLQKEISMPDLVAATFLPGRGLFVGDKSGRIMTVELPTEILKGPA